MAAVRFPTAPLFVPAHTDRLRTKAAGLSDTSFVLDLEDAVPPQQKAEARAGAAAFIAQKPGTAYVRINPLRSATNFSTPCGGDDLLAVVSPGLRGIVLPKVETSADLIFMDGFLQALERRTGLEPGSLELLAIIETAKGIANLAEVTGVDLRRPLCLCFGAGDYSTDLGVAWTRTEEEGRYARSALVTACRAAGLPGPIDSVFPDIADREGLTASAAVAKTLGFRGKFVIHPTHVAVVEEVFAPTADELDWARRVLLALAEAEAEGKGAFVVDGKLVDYPIVARARRIIAHTSA